MTASTKGAMKSARQDGRPADSGFILVAVLWMVAALATLASVYSVYAVNTAAASHVADDRLQAESAVRAGVELAVFQVLAVPESARPTHGAFDARIGRTKVSVHYASEAARIDLNAAPKELLAGLFSAVGVGGATAASYADRVIGWRTKTKPNAENPEAAAYKSAGLPYPPRQAPFTNTLELNLVMGLPPSIVERILPNVTVFSGKAQVDIVNAAPETLAALPGMTPDILHKVLQARANNPDDSRGLPELLGPAGGHVTTDAIKTLRATIQVDLEHGRHIRAEVVFRLADSGDEPYDIVFWRDDFDGPF
jgi:general secretion pathway protein K